MSDPDCCPACGTFWRYHDGDACATEVHRDNERLRDRLAVVERERDDALNACTNAIGAAVLHERESMPVIAAALCATLKEECEAQHARAEQVKAALLRLQRAVRELSREDGYVSGAMLPSPVGEMNRASAKVTRDWLAKFSALLPDPAGTT